GDDFPAGILFPSATARTGRRTATTTAIVPPATHCHADTTAPPRQGDTRGTADATTCKFSPTSHNNLLTTACKVACLRTQT
ncbi:MAG TPA: hypothetical protein IAA93_05575, partial [Candidatus Avibacteroides avistercoris]|nr:hypothetical protein [Candidatus Avibacteroides avistercoris]